MVRALHPRHWRQGPVVDISPQIPSTFLLKDQSKDQSGVQSCLPRPLLYSFLYGSVHISPPQIYSDCGRTSNRPEGPILWNNSISCWEITRIGECIHLRYSIMFSLVASRKQTIKLLKTWSITDQWTALCRGKLATEGHGFPARRRTHAQSVNTCIADAKSLTVKSNI
jgi:hypothetical protein